ncbi:hypothetical protein G195_001740 [Phytophthora kernoviae 00238/432]|uniref:Peptidase C39-like domain-containing protein n=1 Tax=Phytophthora kernoviae 00238/432 TaxID=1284355 RepID=A0A8J4SMW8_9STRA|nr:hypothetical protein G195_001740 [Phytophthora kernoviae 00238/432]
MLLQSAGVTVDKMKLAKDVRKDPTPYTKKNGQVYFGNPYDGFVGDMYSFENPGYGVYHGPIKELADQYLPSKIIDMTGSSFSDVLFSIQRGAPVWVITNTTFSPLSDSRFQTWVTPTGTIQITYKEHAVLVTGFDSNYIYFNDPLANKNRKVAISSFQASWEQMGRQAITYITS